MIHCYPSTLTLHASVTGILSLWKKSSTEKITNCAGTWLSAGKRLQALWDRKLLFITMTLTILTFLNCFFSKDPYLLPLGESTWPLLPNRRMVCAAGTGVTILSCSIFGSSTDLPSHQVLVAFSFLAVKLFLCFPSYLEFHSPTEGSISQHILRQVLVTGENSF